MNTSPIRQFSFPLKLVKEHYYHKLPQNFCEQIVMDQPFGMTGEPGKSPTLYSAHLPNVLDWLHGQENPRIFEENPCLTPLLLYDHFLSTERLLFHYEGTPESARLIQQFVYLFGNLIQNSKSIIISPFFIPKSRMKEEQKVIDMVRYATAETSFIKFNFNRIGDFWSYAVKHHCTILITTKNCQANLAKVLLHFYKGGMWYDRLSFYLAV